MDSAFNNSGSATGITLGTRQSIAAYLRCHFTLSIVTESGSGAVITLVEPAGLGVFPIRRVSGELVSGVCRVDLLPLKQIRIWVIGRVDHRLYAEVEGTNPTLYTLSLGLEWRDFLHW
ncbi:hypothetical protein BMS3Bbin04_01245 [bacterium BMS3Bbin04]|nr:hypothetical protein BMS3Bbin04_01245 [bacterium BMS3Bbin04]